MSSYRNQSDYGYGSSGYDRYGSNYNSGMGGYGSSGYGSSYGGGYGTSGYGSSYGMGGYGSSGYGSSYGSSGYGSSYGSGYGSYGSRYGGYGGGGGYGSSYDSYGTGYGSRMGMGMGGYGSNYEAPGRFGNALAGPSNWMSDFHAVTEGFARFSSLLDANFQAVHGSFFSVINLIERVSHLYREIGFAISGIAVFKIVYSLFKRLINVFRRMTGRKIEEDQLAQAGFDMKSFSAFDNPAAGPMDKPQRASAVGTLIALLGLSFVTIPVALYAINKVISLFKKSDPSQALAAGPVKPFFVRALYDYDGPSQNDLQFRAGDIITVGAKPFEQWWEGEIEYPNGQRQAGLFPANLVEEIDEQTLQLMLRNQQQLARNGGNPYYGNQQQYGPNMNMNSNSNIPPYNQMQTGVRRPGSTVFNIEEVDDFDAMNEDSNQHLVASATSNRSSTPFASQVPSNNNNTNSASNNNNNTNQRVNWANPARQPQSTNNVNTNVNSNNGGLRRTMPARNNNNNNNVNSNVNNNTNFNGKSRPQAQTTPVNSTAESTQ
jgi:peroxin-13